MKIEEEKKKKKKKRKAHAAKPKVCFGNMLSIHDKETKKIQILP
jgi:hypothetical protein